MAQNCKKFGQGGRTEKLTFARRADKAREQTVGSMRGGNSKNRAEHVQRS